MIAVPTLDKNILLTVHAIFDNGKPTAHVVINVSTKDRDMCLSQFKIEITCLQFQPIQFFGLHQTESCISALVIHILYDMSRILNITEYSINHF